MTQIEMHFMEAVNRNLPRLTEALSGDGIVRQLISAVKENTEECRRLREALERASREKQSKEQSAKGAGSRALSLAEKNIVAACRLDTVYDALGFDRDADVIYPDALRLIAAKSDAERKIFLEVCKANESTPATHPSLTADLGLPSGNVWQKEDEGIMPTDQATALAVYDVLIPSSEDFLELTRECEMQWYVGVRSWCFKKGDKKILIHEGHYWTREEGRALRLTKEDGVQIVSLPAENCANIILHTVKNKH